MIEDEHQADIAEYVLGTLDPKSSATLRLAARQDRELAREIYRWQDRLLPLIHRVTPATPQPQTWARIRTRLSSDSAKRHLRWWETLRFWQGLATTALVLAVGLGLQLARSPQIAPVRYVALLQTPQQSIGWVVDLADANTVRLRPVGSLTPPPSGRSWQFWTKPQGANRPTSLGLVSASGTLDIPREKLPALENQQLFEVTLEPEYGSPTGKPTGPVLAIGRMVALAD
ncbi:MAG: anti-sigma factor [Thiobacillus sp.]